MIRYRRAFRSTHSVPLLVPYGPTPPPITRGLLRFTSDFSLWVVLCLLVTAARFHPAQETEQALFTNRAKRVPVEVEDVDVAHLQARLRRRQTECGRDIGQRPTFSLRCRL